MSREFLSSAAEATLAAIAAAGDERAFEELVRRRQVMVRRLMRRLCGDAALADDLAQQAFFQAWRTIRALKAPSAFGGWLRQVAVNVWLQEARRGRLPLAPEAAAEGLPAPNRTGASADRIDLGRALARLKPDERLCVALAYGEGMSHSEVAEATGLALGTVKSHVLRGSARLRSWLDEGEAS